MMHNVLLDLLNKISEMGPDLERLIQCSLDEIREFM
jgi:hypothetical protein